MVQQWIPWTEEKVGGQLPDEMEDEMRHIGVIY